MANVYHPRYLPLDSYIALGFASGYIGVSGQITRAIYILPCNNLFITWFKRFTKQKRLTRTIINNNNLILNDRVFVYSNHLLRTSSCNGAFRNVRWINERHFAQLKLGEFEAKTKLESVNHTYNWGILEAIASVLCTISDNFKLSNKWS